jgi:hypothetical protein
MESPHIHDVDPQYKLWGTRKVSNEYNKVSLYHMFEYSKQFDVKYDGNLESDHKIKDAFIQNVGSQLINYIAKCNNCRNEYVKNHNEGKKPSPAQYIKESKEFSYLDSGISDEDLKKLRHTYLHWSANMATFGMGPRVSGARPASERKRYILNG